MCNVFLCFSHNKVGATIVPVKIFISYAHEDEQLLNALKTHLEGLRRQGLIETWYDRNINAGQQWANEIYEHFNSANIILLLISPDFMASDFINDVELKQAMERHNRGVARVIPIILRPTDWETAPFGKLQALPTDGTPVTTWQNQDQAFLMVAKGIRTIVEHYTAIYQRQKQTQDDLSNMETFDRKAAAKFLTEHKLNEHQLKKILNLDPDELKRNGEINRQNSKLIRDLFPD